MWAVDVKGWMKVRKGWPQAVQSFERSREGISGGALVWALCGGKGGAGLCGVQASRQCPEALDWNRRVWLPLCSDNIWGLSCSTCPPHIWPWTATAVFSYLLHLPAPHLALNSHSCVFLPAPPALPTSGPEQPQLCFLTCSTFPPHIWPWTASCVLNNPQCRPKHSSGLCSYVSERRATLWASVSTRWQAAMATQDGVRLLRVIFGSVCVCAREKGYSYWIGAFYLLPSSHTHTHTHAHTRVCVLTLSRVQLFATLWVVARQAIWSMGFSRQEY